MSSDSAERAARLVPLVAAVGLLVTGLAESQITPMQHSRRATAAAQFVYDGDGFAAVRLGAAEAAVRTLFGPPESESSNGTERRLVYPLRGGIVLEVRVTEGTVAAIAIFAGESGAASNYPKTLRGIRLGAPMGQVTERYGAPTGDRYWYADEGIAFNTSVPADIVQNILVFPRGTAPPN